MSANNKFYFIIKKIHLYASLSTVALLLMYIVTSYMMIYHDYFKVENKKITHSVEVTPKEISENNWSLFLKNHSIKGRFRREWVKDSGDMVKEYENVGNYYKITVFKNKNEVEIVSTQLNLSGKINGLHRMRGYGGPMQYNIYAVMLDLIGIALILFAITGVILWLKLLKHNKLAWTMFILGFIYVSAIVSYLVLG